ncbi:hypothetical protein MMC24_002939 [Lignoscripta atroalba]|nr:hypothetical protein [Lignoscripta atroalba]
MPFLNLLRSKSRKNSNLSSTDANMSSSKSLFGSFSSPTRRPAHPTSPFSSTPSAPPPAYTPSPNTSTPAPILNPNPNPNSTPVDDPYTFLSTFDTIFLIDDSGSMAGRSWRETSQALSSITPICTAHDSDGIDIFFLNHRDNVEYQNITSSADVERIFQTVRPMGGTPTGTRLNAILKPYLRDIEAKGGAEAVKPLNIIVITDGVPSDDVESVVINAAKKLDKWDAPAWQVGIQFFQVGEERGAAEALRELDDGLAELGDGVRDIVDTIPWRGDSGVGLNGEGILKCVLGSVNRRLDRKKNSTEWRR